MPGSVPQLSRFELQCLQRLWARKEATVRDVHGDLAARPGYSTTRKIFERLEEKGAVSRVRLDGRAWVYRPKVSRTAVLRREVGRLLEGLFDGRGASLVAQLADMNELSIEDLREVEERLRPAERRTDAPARSGEAAEGAEEAVGGGAAGGGAAAQRSTTGKRTVPRPSAGEKSLRPRRRRSKVSEVRT